MDDATKLTALTHLSRALELSGWLMLIFKMLWSNTLEARWLETRHQTRKHETHKDRELTWWLINVNIKPLLSSRLYSAVINLPPRPSYTLFLPYSPFIPVTPTQKPCSPTVFTCDYLLSHSTDTGLKSKLLNEDRTKDRIPFLLLFAAPDWWSASSSHVSSSWRLSCSSQLCIAVLG